jgi:hypothetical protein
MVALMGRGDFTLDISPYGGSITEAQAISDRDAIQISTLLRKHIPVLVARRLQAARDADPRAISSCSICMEQWTADRTYTISILGCGHSFYTACFATLRSQRPINPVGTGDGGDGGGGGMWAQDLWTTDIWRQFFDRESLSFPDYPTLNQEMHRLRRRDAQRRLHIGVGGALRNATGDDSDDSDGSNDSRASGRNARFAETRLRRQQQQHQQQQHRPGLP